MSKPNVDRLPSTSHSCNGHRRWAVALAQACRAWGRYPRPAPRTRLRPPLLNPQPSSPLATREGGIEKRMRSTGHTRGLQRAERAGRATGPALALPARGRNLGAAEPAGSLALAGFDRPRPDGRDHQQEAGADPGRRPVEAAAVDDDDRHQVVRTSDSGSGR